MAEFTITHHNREHTREMWGHIIIDADKATRKQVTYIFTAYEAWTDGAGVYFFDKPQDRDQIRKHFQGSIKYTDVKDGDWITFTDGIKTYKFKVADGAIWQYAGEFK